ncbi:hypothetical protein Mapa_007249 [Marchantia paleacea]|nr:hypothetical protein Mapa_007249 [Marchantia paleacea]
MDNAAAVKGHVEQQLIFEKQEAKPRGRPKGSKNKPKPAPPVHLDDNRGDMNIHFLDIPRGEFVIASVAQLASKFVQQGGGVFVVGAKGFVSRVSIVDIEQNRRYLVGAFHILSLSGTIGSARTTKFTITLGDQKFQIWGGTLFGDFQAVQGSVVVKAVSYEGQEAPIASQMHSIFAGDHRENAAWLGIGEGPSQAPYYHLQVKCSPFLSADGCSIPHLTLPQALLNEESRST